MAKDYDLAGNKNGYGTNGTTEKKPAFLQPSGKPLTKTTSASFLEDLANFAEGTVPQSFVMALAIGVTCGVAAWIYYKILFGLLEFIWHYIPHHYIEGVWPEALYSLWIPIVGFSMAVCLGKGNQHISIYTPKNIIASNELFHYQRNYCQIFGRTW